jgi:hypothetical protein
MLFVAQVVIAQGSKPVTDTALVPPAIAAAKKVFVSNAGADDDSGKTFSTGPDHCYSEFFRQVQALNRYEIVSSPLEADLVFEVNMTFSPPPVSSWGGSKSDALVRVRILDPKTQIVLWAFYRRPVKANLQRTGKNLDKAITQITADLKAVTETPSTVRP